MMFFNSWLTFINETYLFLGVCAALNMSYFYFNSPGNTFNSLLSCLFGGIIIVFPFFFIIYYNLPQVYSQVVRRNEEFLSRYGQVLEGLNFTR